ncbi:cell division protein CrgA [Nigerium massiliense]|uniref:cell division protein CrgA n=1 Tax=Nigerium massiliense TaxID=1522317 RepID=UPI000907D3E0|nr:cell division protein CrgA [Nigerium massiliense]
MPEPKGSEFAGKNEPTTPDDATTKPASAARPDGVRPQDHKSKAGSSDTRKPASEPAGRTVTSSKDDATTQPVVTKRPRRRPALVDTRAWVPPTFITLGLLGVLWLVVYYLAGYMIPFMATLGPWNLAVGMGLMAAAFAVATLWK